MGLQELKIAAFQNPIANEADRPNRTAQNMKEIFDSNAQELRVALNAVIDGVDLAASTIRNDLQDTQFLRGDGTYGVPAVGAAANGVPDQGNQGQVLVKASAADFDSEWITPYAVANVTLAAASWVGTNYTITNAEIGANSIVELLPAASANITNDEIEALQNANIQDGGQSIGSITLVARGDVPQIDVPVRLIIRRIS